MSISVNNPALLYEVLNLKIPENIDDFGEEVLDKCSRLLRAKRAYLKIEIQGCISKHFPLGFKNWLEAEKVINDVKKNPKGNVYIYEFDSGLFYIETIDRIDCDWKRIIYSFSKRIKEVVDKIAAECKKVEVEKLRVLIHSIPDAVIVIDETGEVIDINNCFIKISKLSPSEVVGRKIYDLTCFNEEDREKLREAVKCWKEGNWKKVKLTLNGMYFEVNSANVYNTDKFVLVLRDITELELANKKLQTLIDCLRNFVFMKDKNFRYALVNEAFARFVNLPKEEIIGKRDEDILPPELAEMCRKTDMEILKSKTFKRFEVSVKYRGKTLFFEGYKVPVIKGDEVTSIAGVIRDITDRKIIEELKRFKTLLDYSTDAIFIVDESGKIVDANEEARKWIRKCRKRIKNVKVYDVIRGDWNKDVFEGSVAESDRIVLVNVRSATFGDQLYRIVTARDITDFKKAQEKIRDMYEQLKFMNSLLRHDISNSITAVAGYLEMYRETGETEYIDKIEKILDNCIELINNVKEVEVALYDSRELTCINVKDAILKVVEAIKNKNVSITLNLDECSVIADEFIHSVFENLLNNAIVHNDKEDKKIFIDVRCNGEWVEVKIADNGPGIPEEIREDVFKKGFKFGVTGRTGMGLYLVKSLMEKYGGSVELKDNVPEGSLFVLKFKKCDKLND